MTDLPLSTLHADEPLGTGVSWGAILVGAFAAIAVTFTVVALGTGLGLSVVSPWETAGVSATTFKISAGIFLIVIAMFSSSIGGYLAGRLRSRWIGVHTDEVFFRDTAHGFAAWAVATAITFIVIAAPVSSIMGGAASGATQATANATSDRYVDLLLRSDAPPAQQSQAQQGQVQQPQTPQQDTTETRAELGRLFANGSSAGGTMSAEDRTYVSKVVANRTGLGQADADKRVTDVTNRARADADAARKAAAQLAMWLTASLIIGAFCASLAATEGGMLRDGRWGQRR